MSRYEVQRTRATASAGLAPDARRSVYAEIAGLKEVRAARARRPRSGASGKHSGVYSFPPSWWWLGYRRKYTRSGFLRRALRAFGFVGALRFFRANPFLMCRGTSSKFEKTANGGNSSGVVHLIVDSII